MAVNTERGGAIMFLFIAVALFGALGYAFLQGSRTSTTLITSEADKAATYKSQDCTNAVSMATKRLQARGCQVAQISNDSTGAVGSGPTDGSCAIYHPNGGGVKGACGLTPTVPSDSCTSGAIGSVCSSDSAIYVGDAGGHRIYAAPSDEPSTLQWKTALTTTSGLASISDGLANTNAIIADGAGAHPAANACATKAPPGSWYLPAPEEFELFWTNRIPINLPSHGFPTAGEEYWTWFHVGMMGWYYSMTLPNTVNSTNNGKTMSYRVRCVRR